MPSEVSAGFEKRAGGIRLIPGLLCAGAEYPAVVGGDRHFAIFWRVLPWDHAPGALFAREAGSYVARLGGSAYLPASEATGLLVARNHAVAEEIMERLALSGGTAPASEPELRR